MDDEFENANAPVTSEVTVSPVDWSVRFTPTSGLWLGVRILPCKLAWLAAAKQSIAREGRKKLFNIKDSITGLDV